VKSRVKHWNRKPITNDRLRRGQKSQPLIGYLRRMVDKLVNIVGAMLADVRRPEAGKTRAIVRHQIAQLDDVIREAPALDFGDQLMPWTVAFCEELGISS
jgi:hypothetical protein